MAVSGGGKWGVAKVGVWWLAGWQRWVLQSGVDWADIVFPVCVLHNCGLQSGYMCLAIYCDICINRKVF